MKNFFKVLSLSVLAAFIALGCSNTSDNAFTYGLLGLGNDSGAKTAVKTITLVATGDEDAIVFPVVNNNISASIVAGTTDAETLKYYLIYKNEVTGETTLPTADLKFTAGATANIGTVPLVIADGYYTFKLYATKVAPDALTEDGIKAKALFLGQTQADLRTATDTVTFYLTSDTLTGTANVVIGMKTAGWTVPTGYTVSAKITKKTDGTTVQGSGGAPSGVASGITLTTSDVDLAGAQYTQNGVNAGTYNFEVIFNNSGTGKQYVWSDTIIVSPNNNITKVDTDTIAIPEVIELPPAPPTAFNATFKDPDTTSAGYYNVEFTWAAANSINESHFEIDLLDLPDATTWASIKPVPNTAADHNPATADDGSDDWDMTAMDVTSSNITTYGRDFYGNETQNWVDGSLRKNNTKAVIALPLGKRYIARIAAVNDAGPSRYCYVNFAAAVPAALTTGYNKFAADSKVINRYRLSYNIMGGTITDVATPTPGTSTADIVEYRTQNTVHNDDEGTWDTSGATPVKTPGTYVPQKFTTNVDTPSADIWNPALDTQTYASLIKSGKEWTAWRLNSSSSATLYDAETPTNPYNPPDYTDYKNLVLYASYSPTTAAVNILDDNLWTVGIGNFEATIPSGPGVKAADGTATLTYALLEESSQISLNLKATGAGNVTWTGTYTTDQTAAGVVWSNVTYTVKKTDESFYKEGPTACSTSSTGFTATTTLKSYVPGKYAVTFNAYAPHKTLPYTYTIYVNIIEQE